MPDFTKHTFYATLIRQLVLLNASEFSSWFGTVFGSVNNIILFMPEEVTTRSVLEKMEKKIRGTFTHELGERQVLNHQNLFQRGFIALRRSPTLWSTTI